MNPFDTELDGLDGLDGWFSKINKKIKKVVKKVKRIIPKPLRKPLSKLNRARNKITGKVIDLHKKVARNKYFQMAATAAASAVGAGMIAGGAFKALNTADKFNTAKKQGRITASQNARMQTEFNNQLRAMNDLPPEDVEEMIKMQDPSIQQEMRTFFAKNPRTPAQWASISEQRKFRQVDPNAYNQSYNAGQSVARVQGFQDRYRQVAAGGQNPAHVMYQSRMFKNVASNVVAQGMGRELGGDKEGYRIAKEAGNIAADKVSSEKGGLDMKIILPIAAAVAVTVL